MSSAPSASEEATLELEPLVPFAKEVSLPPGATLRTRGLLYGDTYVLVDGSVEICLENNGKETRLVRSGRGLPIGEIAFLMGRPATATVTSLTPTRALFLDNGAWHAFEQACPGAAAEAYRRLAGVAESRHSFNLELALTAGDEADEAAIDVKLCQNPELLHAAQRLRYEVYCEELGRSSPDANPARRVIADALDAAAYVLLAYENGMPVATMRMNKARDGQLGVLENLYGMAQSPLHPEETGVVTKFIVRRDNRLGKSAFRLMATGIDMSARYGVRHCFIDCIPALTPFYAGLGFKACGPPFLHRENGRSQPMMLDLDRYASRVLRLTGFALR